MAKNPDYIGLNEAAWEWSDSLLVQVGRRFYKLDRTGHSDRRPHFRGQGWVAWVNQGSQRLAVARDAGEIGGVKGRKYHYLMPNTEPNARLLDVARRQQPAQKSVEGIVLLGEAALLIIAPSFLNERYGLELWLATALCVAIGIIVWVAFNHLRHWSKRPVPRSRPGAEITATSAELEGTP